MNGFLRAATNVAYTENGALSYHSTTNVCVDQFGKAGSYRGRDIEDVFADQDMLWNENKEFAVKFPFYLRMVTRSTKLADGTVTDTPQRGQGMRDEAFKRLLYFAKYHPTIFYQNLWLLPIVGSWKDLWVLMTMDSTLDQDKIFTVIAKGCESKSQIDLVKKYLPQIRANKKCKTEWAQKSNELAKAFCKWAGWSAHEYRIFKVSGVGHTFQQQISKGEYDKLDWNRIPGKALLNLATGKFITKHGLTEDYITWLSSKPTAKFNGYPYELGMKMKKLVEKQNTGAKIAQMTLDAQFENLLKTAQEGTGAITGNVWCALDTSGSMQCKISDESDVRAFDVCISLGIYFASLNQGAFHKHVVMFSTVSKVMKLKGNFSEMYTKIYKSGTAWGSTNFQSVIDEIVRIRKYNPNIPLSDYPTTLLVVTDGQFDPGYYNQETNYELMKNKLSKVFPKEFVDSMKFIWWQVNGERTTDFPATLDQGGNYFFSGFDGSLITMLLGEGSQLVDGETGEKRTPTMEELIDIAMNQEILQLVKY